MSKRILVIGANGMLGGSLHRYFSCSGKYEILGTVRSETAKTLLAERGFMNVQAGVDALDNVSLAKVIDFFKPDIVFNCVGLIKQMDDSKKPISAIEINALLPHQLALLCSGSGAKLVHFSTDCVFAGKKGGYTESDIPDASDMYGRSKLLGEVIYDGHLTLRTSIIGHELESNVSLIDWFLSQSANVKGFSKAFFSGLPTIYVAEFIETFILYNPSLSGLYHLSVDRIDKFHLLQLVKRQYGIATQIEEYFDFEIDRSLNSDALRSAVGFVPPSWPELIKRMHDEYIKNFQ
ncbi:dTDP-4-dehydrorhamnose reductase family protein [Marinomonas sp.]|uniref:dTDP-4-dehydrorhamnose reductase family protein n=1 Tax=Marinomonas sp. TaxID=1904862 RepID=UPI003BAD868C